MRRIVIAIVAFLLPYGCATSEGPERSSSDAVQNGPKTDGGKGGSSGRPEWTPFQEVAKVGDTKPCSELSYDRIDDCYNQMNPPKPTLSRSVTEAVRGDANVVPSPPRWGEGVDSSEHGGKTQVFSAGRQTLDGRLSVQGGCQGCPYRPTFAAIRPEALDYDHKVKSGKTFQPRNVSGVHPVALWNPVDTTLSVQKPNFDSYEPDALHNTICEDGTQKNPHHCVMKRGGQDIEGDCYQVTLLFGAKGPDARETSPSDIDKRKTRWELRSSDLTVVVPNAKTDSAGDNTNENFVYPRIANPTIDAQGRWVLPAIEEFNLPFSWEDFIHPGKAYRELLTNPSDPKWGCYTANAQPKPNAPSWCQYYFGQRSLSTFDIDDNGNDNINDGQTACVGERGDCKHNSLFELSVTGDGRLLVLNLNDKGIFYSYNQGTPCHADGFSRLRPLSFMPVDPVLSGTTYGVVKSTKGHPFTTSMGEPMPPGSLGNGAYPWIAANGSNIAWAQMNGGRDGYYARRATAYKPGASSAEEVATAFGFETGDPNHALNPDLGGAGKGVTVLGAWTQGKMVVVDNGLNATDFHRAVLGQEVSYDEFDMQLYSFEGPRRIRPKGSSLINSWENKLNHFDAVSPVLPFDVVWGFSSNNQHNSEVAFDRYMNQRALVVAHMNAPIDTCSFGLEMVRDGFVPAHPEKRVRSNEDPGFHFAESPLLQNASTANGVLAAPGQMYVNPPKTLKLRGGARVEPVALGGVLGKGVYLDGGNDFIETTIPPQPQTIDHAYLGLWVNPRSLGISDQNVLYSFSDNSWIGLEFRHLDPNTVGFLGVAFDGKTGTKSEAVLARGPAPTLIQVNDWRHVGVALRRTAAGNGTYVRSLDFYLSGTYSNTVTFTEPTSAEGFPLAGRLTIGGLPQKPTGTMRNFGGWIDELTILAYTASELGAPDTTKALRELFCNEALGTMVDISVQPNEAPSPLLTALRARFAELPQARTQVCESMRLASTNLPLDFAPQEGSALCIDRFHKNPHAISANRCIRKSLLEVATQFPFVTTNPRPSFAGNAFCTGCHREGATTPGLLPDKLNPGLPNVPRYLDPRRQPLDWPAFAAGVVPAWGASVPASQQRYLDFLFDQGPKIAP